MAKLKNFKGGIPLSSGITGIGNRDYPLVQAHDIQVDEDGTRLDEVLENIGDGGNANFIFADSVEELPDPKTVSEGTVALVPSTGESGGDTTELEERVSEIERDHGNNTNFVLRMTGIAENPENDGKVYGIKDEEIVVMDFPSGGGTDELERRVDELDEDVTELSNRVTQLESINNIRIYNSLEEVPADLPEGTIVLVPSEDDGGDTGFTVELTPDDINNGTPTIPWGEGEPVQYVDNRIPSLTQLMSCEMVLYTGEHSITFTSPVISNARTDGYEINFEWCGIVSLSGGWRPQMIVITNGTEGNKIGIYLFSAGLYEAYHVVNNNYDEYFDRVTLKFYGE